MKKYSHRSKRFLHKSLGLGSASLGLLAALCANNAAKSAVLYFDPNGASAVTAGTYTWNTTSAEFATSTTLTASTVVWNSADAVCFTAGSFSGAITVDVNSAITDPGLFNGALTPPGCTLTIAGSGSLNFGTGIQGLDTSGSDGAPTTIAIPITGSAEVEPQGVNSLYLYGVNTYSGGTLLDGTGGVNFNNNAAFGTGTIGFDHTTMTMASQGSSALTIANAVNLNSLTGTTPALNGPGGDTLTYVGGATAATTFTGAFTLPGAGTNATISVSAGTPMAITGAFKGAGNFIKTGAGTMVASGVSTATGTLTISGGVLKEGVANAFAANSEHILAGGTLDPGGFNQANTGKLGMTSSSIIDFEAGTALISYANSSSLTWAGTLTINNYVYGDDNLKFGLDDTGLTSAQLADIDFTGYAPGAMIDNSGDVIPTPEPSTAVLGVVGGLGVFLGMRRRKA